MPKINWELLEQNEYIGEYGVLGSPGDVVRSAVNLCGCGSEEIGEILYETLRWSSLEYNHDGSKSSKGGPEWKNGCYRSLHHEMAMKILDSYGLTEHGIGIGWAWITNEGRKLLALIDASKFKAKEDSKDE